MRKFPSSLLSAAPLLLGLTLLASCAHDDDARVTGSGGKHLHYSSTQKVVDLTAEQRGTLVSLQDRYYRGLAADTAVASAATALRQMKFNPVLEQPLPALVEGESDGVLVSHGREILRGAAKAKGLPLPARPDHQSTRALVAVREGTAAGTLVHVEFETTVWDSAGNSRSTTPTTPELYQAFFDNFTPPGTASAVPQG
jgi:hypothetical protein